MKYCVASAFVAAVLAAIGFTTNALFDHSASTNLAILGLLVGLVLAGIPSRGVVPGLAIVGLLVAGPTHHLAGYLVSLKIAGWVSGGLIALSVVALMAWQAPAFLRSFRPRTRAEREATRRQWEQYNEAMRQQAVREALEAERLRSKDIKQARERARRQRAEQKERQAHRRLYRRGERELLRSDWHYYLGLRDILAGDVLVFWPEPGGRRAHNNAGRIIEPVDQGQRFPVNPFIVLPSARAVKNLHTGEMIEFADARPTVPVYENQFMPDPNGRTRRSTSGKVIEVIQGAGDTFVVIESPERQAENERQGVKSAWTREV